MNKFLSFTTCFFLSGKSTESSSSYRASYFELGEQGSANLGSGRESAINLQNDLRQVTSPVQGPVASSVKLND